MIRCIIAANYMENETVLGTFSIAIVTMYAIFSRSVHCLFWNSSVISTKFKRKTFTGSTGRHKSASKRKLCWKCRVTFCFLNSFYVSQFFFYRVNTGFCLFTVDIFFGIIYYITKMEKFHNVSETWKMMTPSNFRIISVFF